MNSEFGVKKYIDEIDVVMNKQLDLLYNYFSSADIEGYADDFPFFSLFVNLKKNLYEAAVKDLYKQGFGMSALLEELNSLPEFKEMGITIFEQDGDLVLPEMTKFLGRIPNTKKNKYAFYRLDLLSFNRYTLGLEYILFKAEIKMVDRLYNAFKTEADNWSYDDFIYRQEIKQGWVSENKKLIEGYEELEDEFGYCPNSDFMLIDSYKTLKFTDEDKVDEFGNELTIDEIPLGIQYKRFREQANYYTYCEYRKYPCYSKALTLDDHYASGLLIVEKLKETNKKDYKDNDLFAPEENHRIHSLWEVNTDKTYGCRLIKDEDKVDIIACVPYLGEDLVRTFHDVKSGGYVEHEFQEVLTFRIEKEKISEFKKVVGKNKILSVFDIDEKYAYFQINNAFEWEYKDYLVEVDSIMVESNVGVPALHFSKDYKGYLFSVRDDLLSQGYVLEAKVGGNFTADAIEFFDFDRINDKKKNFARHDITWYDDDGDDEWETIVKDSQKEVKNYQKLEDAYWKLIEEQYGDLDYQPGMEPTDESADTLKIDYVEKGSFSNQLIIENDPKLETDKKKSKYKKVDKFHYTEHIENPSYHLNKNHFLNKIVYRLGDVVANESVDAAKTNGESFELLGKEALLKNYNTFLKIVLSILGAELESSTFTNPSILEDVVKATYHGMYKSLVSQALTVQTIHGRTSSKNENVKKNLNKEDIQKLLRIHNNDIGPLTAQYDVAIFTDEQIKELNELLSFELPVRLQ